MRALRAWPLGAGARVPSELSRISAFKMVSPKSGDRPFRRLVWVPVLSVLSAHRLGGCAANLHVVGARCLFVHANNQNFCDMRGFVMLIEC